MERPYRSSAPKPLEGNGRDNPTTVRLRYTVQEIQASAVAPSGMTLRQWLNIGGAARCHTKLEIICAAIFQKRQPVIPSAVKSKAMNGVEESQVATSI